MKKLVMLLFCLNVFGCASTSTPTVDIETTKEILKMNSLIIDDEILLKNVTYVQVDELEGQVYYDASDWNDWLLGNSYSKIFFTYYPETKAMIAEFRSLRTEWIHSEWISVYIGKEKIINKSSGEQRRTSVSQVASGGAIDHIYTHEWYKFSLTVEQAEKLANAKPDEITLRFGGGNAGYVDQKMAGNSDFKGLKAVVELMNSTSSF